MKIIETFIKGKNNDQSLCEDAIVITNYYIAVIDGSTSKGNHDYGVKSGKLASQLLKEEIEGWTNNKMSASEACDKLSKKIQNYYVEKDIIDEVVNNAQNRITASVIIYSIEREEVWQIGDCQMLVDGELINNPKTIDALATELRVVYLLLMGLEGKDMSSIKKHDEGREYILPLLRKQCILQNNPKAGKLSYGVIDGMKVSPEHIKITNVKNVKELVLASDGYPLLKATLKDSEEYLEQIMQEDPMCYKKFHATKGLVDGQGSFDDRSYIRIIK